MKPTKPTKRRAGEREYVVGFAPGGRRALAVIGGNTTPWSVAPLSRKDALEMATNGMDGAVDRVIYRLVPERVVKARRSK